MAKETGSKNPATARHYRRVAISALQRGRRGKHHELVESILRELASVPPGSALEIPLAEVNGIGLANLRSAVHRGCKSAGLNIETVADQTNFYVWKPESGR